MKETGVNKIKIKTGSSNRASSRRTARPDAVLCVNVCACVLSTQNHRLNMKDSVRTHFVTLIQRTKRRLDLTNALRSPGSLVKPKNRSYSHDDEDDDVDSFLILF